MKSIDTVQVEVQKYYSQEIQTSSDLKTGACCTNESIPEHLKSILAEIHPEISSKYYGCGSPLPELLEGKTILDLGCGTGQDVFMAAKLAGPQGKVYGVDMTPEQIDIAKKYQKDQLEKWDLPHDMVEFKLGKIEELTQLGIPEESIDIVISNCVLNLAHDKESVFQEILKVLKPGGELFFSDIYSDRRIPQELKDDPVLYGECLSGALYVEDFRRLLMRNQIFDYRKTKSTPVPLLDSDIQSKLGHIQFNSITYRVFKLELEDKCEEYGQVVKYLGGIENQENNYRLDDHHLFEKGKWESVCGNTFDMLHKTRLKPYFEFMGDQSTHYGIYGACYDNSDSNSNNSSGACC